MEKKTEKNKKNTPQEVKKSVRLMSLKEYVSGKPIRRERIAAVRIQLEDKPYRTREEWDSLFYE